MEKSVTGDGASTDAALQHATRTLPDVSSRTRPHYRDSSGREGYKKRKLPFAMQWLPSDNPLITLET
jgi:hypothetical protein